MGTSSSSNAVVLLIAVLLVHSSAPAEAAAIDQQEAAACPIEYTRHSLDQIRSREKTPYLLGGIYNSADRPCPNCRRGGLWSDFCSFRHVHKSAFWAAQVCNSSTVDSALEAALRQDNAAELLTMTPCDLWPYLRGRTTWIIGDSMSKDLFKALRCFMVEFDTLSTYHASSNFTAMHLLQAIPGQGEPHCAHLPDNTRICQVHAIEGDLFVAPDPTLDRTSVGGVLPLIQQHLALNHDFFIVHFGLWHGETRHKAYKKYLHQLGQHYQDTKHRFPHLLFMETPKQHFDSEDGDFKVSWLRTRKGPWNCQPIKGVSLNPDGTLTAEQGNAVAQYVVAGSWRNQLAAEVLSQYELPLLPIYNSTATAWDFHRSNLAGQECSHFCHPSVPQFWLWHLLKVLRQVQLPLVQDPSKQKLQAGCAKAYERDESRFGSARPAAASDQELQQRFWDWLFGRKAFVLHDGALVPANADATGSAVLDPSNSQGQGINTPWAGLQQLLELLQAQRLQQGGDVGQRQAGIELLQAEAAPQQPQQQAEDRSQQQTQQEKGSRWWLPWRRRKQTLTNTAAGSSLSERQKQPPPGDKATAG